MSVCKTTLIFINLFFIINLLECAEYVPVYLWSTSKGNDRVPALHKLNQDSFKDDLLERLKENPLIVVFAEQTLSPEDFTQRDQSGALVFSHLSKLSKESKISYLPYVQNPIKVLKHLDREVTEWPISSLRKNIDIPKSNILIVELNDAADDEHRLDMLKRHDADISLIYNAILQKHNNVLALYTSHHTSWVAPEDVISSRKVRSLLATEDELAAKFFQLNDGLIYLTNSTFSTNNGQDITVITDLNFTSTKTSDSEIVITGQSTAVTIEFTVSYDSTGYWFMNLVKANHNNTDYNATTTSKIYAPVSPLTFSYHCGDQKFSFENTEFIVYLTDFQIQPVFEANANVSKFFDAYDCVGFTSVPIWSGIFVTTILLLIMTFGITMMMDIRTMDRFDDAKGKTITINAE